MSKSNSLGKSLWLHRNLVLFFKQRLVVTQLHEKPPRRLVGVGVIYALLTSMYMLL